MAASVFHVDARGFGVLSSMMAVGTITGALLAARRDRPRFRHLWIGAALFGCTLAALAPGYWLFGAALVLTGIAAITFMNSTNSRATVDRAGDARACDGAASRGGARRHADRRAGGRLGRESSCPRWALGVGAMSGFAAALVATHFMKRMRAQAGTGDGA